VPAAAFELFLLAAAASPASPAFQVSYMVKLKKIGGVKLNYSGSDVTLIKT
jgi:hypothetical protein